MSGFFSTGLAVSKFMSPSFYGFFVIVNVFFVYRLLMKLYSLTLLRSTKTPQSVPLTFLPTFNRFRSEVILPFQIG